MKKTYFSPEVSLIELANEDILTLSLSTNTQGYIDGASFKNLFKDYYA